MPYRAIDHTADLGLDLTGESLGELFADAVRGFFASTIEISSVTSVLTRRVEVTADAPDLLLHSLLGELLFFLDTENLVLPWGSVSIRETPGGWVAVAELAGEYFDRTRHPQKVQIKAVTYHELTVEAHPDGWRGRVIFDI